MDSSRSSRIEPAVPHLITALNGPLRDIETRLLERQDDIEQWLHAEWLETPAPFYTSVDLRNAGFKLAPIDTNLFPGGFNNLNPAFLPLCVQAVQVAVERFCPMARRVLIIPENHTRNQFYLENVAALEHILKRAGLNVRIGSLLPEVTQPTRLELPSGRSLVLEPLVRDGNRIRVGDFDPCLVLLNNDLSLGPPPVLMNLTQPVVPPLAIGWWKRLKSDHFAQYRRIAVDFAERVDMDPWLIDPMFRRCGRIDFQKREGEDCLAENVADMLNLIRVKYDQYGIEQEPFVIVKADSGTYGMGIMTVRSPDEVRHLNRKQRNKMAVSKDGQSVQNVMVQEGVYTFETWGEASAVAEPVVYLFDRFVVGGFYRMHSSRGSDENLNAPGMEFQSLAFADSCGTPDPCQAPDARPNRFYAYGVIARLAALAAARELRMTTAESPVAPAP